MKNLRLRFVLGLMAAVGLSLAAFQCGHRDPLSPETQGSIGTDGVLKIDMRLSKSVALTIDSVTVVARRAQGEPVRARLEIRGNQATGSLKVSPGEGWAITAEVYSEGDRSASHRGQSRPITIKAGQTVPVNIVVEDLRPHITILKPDKTETVDERFVIRWMDEDIDSDATITLFYDVDNSGKDGTPIPGAGVLKENDETDSFMWDTSALPNGRYYIYAKIDDGEHKSFYAYSPSPLVIEHLTDLVAEEVFLTLPDAAEPIDPKSLKVGDKVDLNVRVRNTGSVAIAGWRSETYIDGTRYSSGENHSIDANTTTIVYVGWTVVSGTHTVEFRVDTGDVVRESNEANNTARLTFTVGVSVDLVAEEVFLTLPDAAEPIDPKSLKVGDKVDLNVRVRNTGSVAITGWRSETYIDGTRYSSGENHSVDANSTTIVYVGWTVVSGTHTVEFRLDTGDAVRESNEANNTASLTFTVGTGSEGSIIAGKSVEGVEIGFTKEQVTAKLGSPSTVDESGNFIYGSLGIGVLFRSDQAYMILVLGSYSGSTRRGIRIGSSISDVVAQYGTDYTDEPVGDRTTYWYRGIGIAFTFDERDRVYAITIFAPSDGERADLKVGRVYISERDNPSKELSDVRAGDEVDLRLEYENTGPVDATGWRAEVYIDGVLQGALNDASIAAGESKVIRYQWTALSGTHTVEFRLDTGDAVKESNEANNTARLTFTVGTGSEGSIIAGKSVEGVEIGFTKNQVIAKLGQPDRINEDGNFFYSSLVVIFEENRVSMIIAYSGMTEKGIGIGAPISDVVAKYGRNYHEEQVGERTAYFYFSLGIAFVFDEGQVYYIVIFPPASAKVASAKVAWGHTDIMEKLRTYASYVGPKIKPIHTDGVQRIHEAKGSSVVERLSSFLERWPIR